MSVFEHERRAMNGEEMPDGLTYSDQILYLSLRMLYDQYKKGIVSRETASREKKKLLAEHERDKFREQMGEEWVRILRETELARAECRKNPCPESAMRLVKAIEGRKFGKFAPNDWAQKDGDGNG